MKVYYYYRYSALGPVWAETIAQSVDWYGSGTLHPGQVLRGNLPLLSPDEGLLNKNAPYADCGNNRFRYRCLFRDWISEGNETHTTTTAWETPVWLFSLAVLLLPASWSMRASVFSSEDNQVQKQTCDLLISRSTMSWEYTRRLVWVQTERLHCTWQKSRYCLQESVCGVPCILQCTEAQRFTSCTSRFSIQEFCVLPT